MRDRVVRGVGVLVGGTTVAQALAVLALPLITRLYTPDDFSLLAVYSSLLGIIAALACLRLEIAIPIPESDEDAASLLRLALASATLVALSTGFALVAFGEDLVKFIQRPEFRPYLWLLPIGVWLSGTYAALQYWSSRTKRFPAIARTRVAQAIGGVCVQTGFGLTSAGPLGLLLGQVVSSGAGIAGLAGSVIRRDREALRTIGLRRMLSTLRKYDRFPRYSTLEAFADTGGTQIPIIIIAAAAAGPEAGLVLLATRVMSAPMGLIGGAVSQVYLSTAPAESRAGRLGHFTTRIIGGLLKAGVGPLLFAGIVSPFAFSLIFGEQWRRAGEIVTYMTPWFVMRFVTSPVSMALHVLDHQVVACFLQIFGLLLRVGAVVMAAYFAEAQLVEIYAASEFVYYLVYFLVVGRVTGLKFADLLQECRSALRYSGVWLFAALLVAIALAMLPETHPG